MKHHHSRRESPAGNRAAYARRPVEFAPGATAGGRKGIVLLWVDQGRSKWRANVRRFAQRHGLALVEVQRLGALVCFEAAGHPAALAELCGRPEVERWEPVVDARVREPRLPEWSGERQVKIAQRPKPAPLPPLPPCRYTFASR